MAVTSSFTQSTYNCKAGDLVLLTYRLRWIYNVDSISSYASDLYIEVPTLTSTFGAYFFPRTPCDSAYTSGSSYTNYNPVGTDGWTSPKLYGYGKDYLPFLGDSTTGPYYEGYFYTETVGGVQYGVREYNALLTIPSDLATSSHTVRLTQTNFYSSGGTARATCTINVQSVAAENRMSGSFRDASVTVEEGKSVVIEIDYTNPADNINTLYLVAVPMSGEGIPRRIYYGTTGVYIPQVYVKPNNVSAYSNYITDYLGYKQMVKHPTIPGRAFFRVEANSDYATEGNQNYTLALRRDSYIGPTVATVNLTVVDDSTAGTKLRTNKENNTVYEDDLLEVSVEYTSNTQLYWTVDGTTTDFEDINGTCTTPVSSVINGVTKYLSKFFITPKITTSGTRPTTFTASARTTSTSGTEIGTRTFTVIRKPAVTNQGLQVYKADSTLLLDTSSKADILLGVFTVTKNQNGFVLEDPRLSMGTPYFFYQGSTVVSMSFEEDYALVEIGYTGTGSKAFYGIRT